MRTDPASAPWSRLRSGVLLLAGLAAVATVVFFLDEVLRELSEGPELHVAAREARNLRPGAEVWVAGVPAGRVLSVRFRPPDAEGAGEVVVRTVLREDGAELIRADASAVIRESALLAPSVVAIRPGDAEAPFDFSDTLRAEQLVSALDVMARADSLTGRLESLRPLAERMGTRLREGPGTLAALRGDGAPGEELAVLTDQLRRLAARAGEGTVPLLRRDTALAARWERIGARADTLERALPSGEVARLDTALASLEGRIAVLETRLTEPRGSIGRFLHDGALERELGTARARVDSLRAELLADPLRWLRIRLF